MLEEFGYSALGELTDIWELTPQSAGWYHITQSYWANGARANLSSTIASLPAFSYGVDGQGRANSVSAGSGQNPVTDTSYNASS